MNSQQGNVRTSLGELIVAIYEAALDELRDERLAQRVTATLVTEVLLRTRS